MSEYCIETEHLVRRFGNKTAIDNLDLKIPIRWHSRHCR